MAALLLVAALTDLRARCVFHWSDVVFDPYKVIWRAFQVALFPGVSLTLSRSRSGKETRCLCPSSHFIELGGRRVAAMWVDNGAVLEITKGR